MGHDRCCVGTCDNDRRYPDKLIDRRYPDKLIVSSNVTSVMWHKFPKEDIKRKRWVKLISKGRADFEPVNCSRVCSVHFPDGKPTTSLNPDPTLFLTIQDNREKEKKYLQFQGRKNPRERPISSKVTTSSKRLVLSDDKSVHDNDIKEKCTNTVSI